MTDGQAQDHTAHRGLATVAFLKARFDAGKDHFGLFQPFVEDAIRHYETDDINVGGLQKAIRASTGLRIPVQVLKTLLRRAVNQQMLTRIGGNYRRTPNQADDPEFSEEMERLGRTHLRLGERLRHFAAQKGQILQSDDDALAALTRFLDANQIGIALGQALEADTPFDTPDMKRTIAAFVSEIVEEGGQDSDVLDTIVKGVIVQNALLLRDIPSIRRELHRLTVFVDTGVLLRALGYAGPTEQRSAAESLSIIHAAGAKLRVFERTVNEIEGVLKAYERHLGSSAGIKALRASELTDHFLAIRARPSDIAQGIALLRRNLADLGFQVRDYPAYIRQYTENEHALGRLLRYPNRSEEDDADRVQHDVRAISAVLTLRRGHRPRRLATAGYVFASGSRHTVSAAHRWWNQDSDLHGLQPIVHFRAVTNAAWLCKPASASSVPMRDLVALCAAVLRPSVQTWSRFVGHLDRLVKSGELSDDASIAVMASHLTQVELSAYSPERELEPRTVDEIVEKVRREQEAELRPELDESPRKLEESQRETLLAQARENSTKNRVSDGLRQLATWIMGTGYGLFCLLVLVGAVLPLITEQSIPSKENLGAYVAWWVCVFLFLAVSLLQSLSLSRRFQVSTIFFRLRDQLAGRLRRWLLPESEYD